MIYKRYNINTLNESNQKCLISKHAFCDPFTRIAMRFEEGVKEFYNTQRFKNIGKGEVK